MIGSSNNELQTNNRKEKDTKYVTVLVKCASRDLSDSIYTAATYCDA